MGEHETVWGVCEHSQTPWHSPRSRVQKPAALVCSGNGSLHPLTLKDHRLGTSEGPSEGWTDQVEMKRQPSHQGPSHQGPEKQCTQSLL